MPIGELRGIGDSPFQGDVGVFVEPVELAHSLRLVTLAVLDRVVTELTDRHLGKAGLLDAIDLQPIAEVAERILTLGHCCYSSSPSLQALASCVFWKTRKMTNSAGRTGAIPTSIMSRPLRISSSVIVSRPTLTENASSSL